MYIYITTGTGKDGGKGKQRPTRRVGFHATLTSFMRQETRSRRQTEINKDNTAKPIKDEKARRQRSVLFPEAAWYLAPMRQVKG